MHTLGVLFLDVLCTLKSEHIDLSGTNSAVMLTGISLEIVVDIFP